MNKKQKVVLIIATIFIVGICLNPPRNMWGDYGSFEVVQTFTLLIAAFTSAFSCIYLLKSKDKSNEKIKEKSTIPQ